MVKLNEKFIVRKENSETILFNTFTGNVYLLNDVASSILELIEDKGSAGEFNVSELIANLTEEYDIEDAALNEVGNDVEAILNDFIQKEILIGEN